MARAHAEAILNGQDGQAAAQRPQPIPISNIRFKMSCLRSKRRDILLFSVHSGWTVQILLAIL